MNTEQNSQNSTEARNDDNTVLAAVLLDVNERYYFKTRGQEPDVECTKRCMFRNNGICIGSAACQECEHHFENNVDEWGCISWIKCRKINEAVSKNGSNVRVLPMVGNRSVVAPVRDHCMWHTEGRKINLTNNLTCT